MISKKLCHTLNNNIKHMKLMKQSFSSKMNVVVNMCSRNKEFVALLVPTNTEQ
uniref:Uncharacterized protein n=1 Tax=Anguilla anguilla TaxID=7936 RepID=A0A0E9UQ36_ANGAN